MSNERTNSSVLRSLVWKEIWQLKDFFLAMILLATLVNFLTYAAVFLISPKPWIEFAAAYFLPLFAAACGATLYATEKETGTFQTLQFLPLHGRTLRMGKIIAAMTICLAFLVSIGLLEYWRLLPGLFIDGLQNLSVGKESFAIFFGVFGLAMIEFFAWSWLISLRTSKPLNAAMLGIFFASAGIQLAVLLSNDPTRVDFISAKPYLAAWPWRVAIMMPVILVATYFSGVWLNPQKRISTWRKDPQANTPLAGAAPSYPGRRQKLLRLTWQTFRQSTASVLFSMAVVIAFCGVLTALNTQLIGWTLPVILTSGGFAGLAAFSADHKPQSRQFLTALGISPLQIWVSRVVPWLTLLTTLYSGIVILVAIGVCFWAGSSIQSLYLSLAFGQRTELNFFGFSIGLLAVYAIYGAGFNFAIGQFISNLIPSRILAAVATTVTCFVFSIWYLLMVLGGVPLWWSVFPLSIVFLLSGYLSFRGLFGEYSVVQSKVIPVVMVAISMALTMTGVVFFRAQQIPTVALDFASRPAPNSTIIREIESRFLNAASAISKTNKDILASYDIEIEVTTNQQGIKKRQRVSGRNALEWLELNASSELGQKISNLEDRVRYRENREQMPAIYEAIAFAVAHQDQLKNIPAGLNELNAELIAFFRNRYFLHLLNGSFHSHLASGKIDAAWQDLQTLTDYFLIWQIVLPHDRQWYSWPLEWMQQLAEAKGITPKMLRKAMDFTILKFQPLSAERVLEEKYHRLLKEEASLNLPSSAPFSQILNFVKQLSFEQQRTKRLIGIQFAIQLHQIRIREKIRRQAIQELQLPDNLETWALPFADMAIERKKQEIAKRSIPDRFNQEAADLMSQLDGDEVGLWALTTFLPVDDYEDLPTLDRIFAALTGNHPPTLELDLDQYFRERKQLAILQNWFIRFAKENGQFPKSLRIVDFVLDGGDPPKGAIPFILEPQVPPVIIVATPSLRVAFHQGFRVNPDIAGYLQSNFFYSANGFPNAVTIGNRKGWKIPAYRPFISNRRPLTNDGKIFELPQLAEKDADPRGFNSPPMILPLNSEPTYQFHQMRGGERIDFTVRIQATPKKQRK